MEQAAKHLPADSVRPAMILFSDGKHDVKGVPVSQVGPARDRLFGSRSPFALLPVGMGLAAKDRAALEAGLNGLRIIRDMPACVSGATFDWPRIVFDSAGRGGRRGRRRAPGRDLHVHASRRRPSRRRRRRSVACARSR